MADSRRQGRDDGPSGGDYGDKMRLSIPPQNLVAERSALASFLLDNDRIDEVAGSLKPEHFYSDIHQTIFAAICEMYAANKRADVVTLAEHLDKARKLEEFGGAEFLVELLETVPHSSHAADYAAIVVDKYRRRTFQQIGRGIVLKAVEEQHLEDAISSADLALVDVANIGRENRITSLDDTLADALAAINGRDGRQGLAGLTTGNNDVDAITAGLVGSTLTVVAARPSMGKTAYMLGLAEAAATGGTVTAIFSLEQSRLALAERFMVRRAMVDGHAVRTGAMGEADRFAILEAARALEKLPILIDDTPNLSVSEIAASARRLKRRKNLGLVLIDYLQYIKADDLKTPREQQVAQITKRLKGLAKSLDVPVVVLAQLNRGVEAREDKKPRMADLRESGAIEQDADMILFLHRPDQYDPEDRPGQAEVIVAKNRDGRTGIAQLVYRKHCFRFESVSHDEPPPDERTWHN